MKKSMAVSFVLIAAVSLAGCASYPEEETEPAPVVKTNTNDTGQFTMVKELPDSTHNPVITPGLYKICDGTTLVYFSYGSVAGTESYVWYGVNSLSAVTNSPECVETTQ